MESNEGIVGLLNYAFDIAQLSPDPWMKVGCVGFGMDNNAIEYGYNCVLTANASQEFWIDREGRRPFIVHAEIHMLSKLRDTTYKQILRGVVITLFPCCACLTALAAFGCNVIYYRTIYDKDKPALDVAKFYGIETYPI